MKKSINKLWSIVTLGMICLFVAFAYANAAFSDVRKSRSDIELLNSKIDSIIEKSKAIQIRLESIEKETGAIDLKKESASISIEGGIPVAKEKDGESKRPTVQK